MATDPKILNLEADARFAVASGRPVGQKLDPSNPADAALIPQWKDIFAKVKAEDTNGTLVLTYDHPAVAQPLADASVAAQAAEMHHRAKEAAPDPATAQQHADAAAVATSVADQKTQEAAVAQNAVANGAAPPEIEMPPMDMRPPAQGVHARLGPGHGGHGHVHTAKGIIDKETDARFAAQSGVTHKLDPANPADAKLIPMWLDIYKKVKAEDRAGKLVITYNHPVVAQNIADAQVADTIAASSIDTAAATPDPAVQQANIAQAAVATQVSAQKTREASQLQPPTVSPQIAHEAARKTHAERGAREGHGKHGEGKRVEETYKRFWALTHYRPGQPLDPRDPQYARMLQIWTSIYAQMQGAPGAHHGGHGHGGHGPRTGRDHIAEQQAGGAGHRASEAHQHHHKHRGGRPVQSTMGPGSVQNYRAQAGQLAQSTGAPFALVVQHPDGTPEQHGFGTRPELDAAYTKIADQHDQYRYVGAFDNANPSTPIADSVGVPAAEHVEQPADAGGAAPSDQAPAEGTAPEGEKKSGIGKIIAVVAVVAAAGGIAYMATRKPSRKGSSPSASTTMRVAKLPFPGASPAKVTVTARP